MQMNNLYLSVVGLKSVAYFLSIAGPMFTSKKIPLDSFFKE